MRGGTIAIVKAEIDPYWHEKELIVTILSKGALSKQELFKRIRQEQNAKVLLGDKGWSHSRSAYEYWVKSRSRQWVVNEHEGKLELTPLGKWLVKFQITHVLREG